MFSGGVSSFAASNEGSLLYCTGVAENPGRRPERQRVYFGHWQGLGPKKA